MDKKLKNEIVKKLDKMEANLEDQEMVRLRWQFVDKFICCEVACKLVLQAYHKSEGKEVALKDEKLIMNSILAAMKWAKMDFAKEELEAMFSSQGKFKKRGTKSAKMLRHGSMHEHNEQDILEIVSRFDELNRMMDTFLETFSQAETEQKPKERKKKPERTSGSSPDFCITKTPGWAGEFKKACGYKARQKNSFWCKITLRSGNCEETPKGGQTR